MCDRINFSGLFFLHRTMLKHVQLRSSSSLLRPGQKADTLSINSNMSFCSLQEPTLSSRSSSYTSLNETQSSTGSSGVPPASPSVRFL